MAAYDEEATIATTLDYLDRQDYPGPLRIIVVDDGSGDRTPEVVRERAARDPRVELWEPTTAARPGPSTSRRAR